MLKETPEEETEAVQAPAERPPEEEVQDYLRVDTLGLEIGYALIPLIDTEQGGDLLGRITQIRKQCAAEIGIIIPPVRIRDNIQLKPNEYVVQIRGNTVAKGALITGHLLALNPGTAEEKIEGQNVIEPAFGLPATWILPKHRNKAEMLGYTVVETVAVLTTHILEVLKGNAHLILSRQDVQNLLENLKKDQAVLVEELVPGILSLGTVEKVLQNLLRERISIRNLATILETLADWGTMTKDTEVLTEYVRQALSETIVQPYVDDEGVIRAITLSPAVEQYFSNAIQEMRKSGFHGVSDQAVLPPDMLKHLYTELAVEVDKLVQTGFQPIIVTSPLIRHFFRRMVESVFPNLIVISYGEVPSRFQIEAAGSVRFENDR